MIEPFLPLLFALLLRASVMLCVLCACLVVLRPLRIYLGARRAYLLWAALPLGLVTLALPNNTSQAISVKLAPVVAPMQEVAAPVLNRLQNAAPQVQPQFWLTLWMLGTLTSVALYMWLLMRWQKRMRSAPDSPAVLGVFHPTIVLPADFAKQFTPAQQQLIRAHEQAHIAHRDPLWNLLFALLHAVFWFHPLMLWAHRAFRFDQELACDAAALAAQPSLRQTYAAALVQCNTPAPWQAVGCQWRNSHPLLERIHMLKYLTQNPSLMARSGKLLIIGFLLLLSAAVAYAVQANQVHPTEARSGSSTPNYWIAMTLEHQGKQMAAPTVLISEGQQAEVRVAQNEATTVDGTLQSQHKTPAFRLTVVPTAAANGLTQLQMKIYLGTPEKLMAEPVLKIAGPGSVRFGDSATGIYTLNLATRIAAANSTTPPTDLIATAPIYPPTAQALRQQGRVMVRAKIDLNGRVTQAEVEWADPAGVFEESALSSARAKQFNVASLVIPPDGWVHIPIQFALD
jgi:TonB family protein